MQRDRHAEVLATLAIVGSTIEKIALEIRGAQRTEVRELAEPFGRGQKGSSAMPHKRNPILSERLCGMARLLRGYASVGFEDNALWQERDISLLGGARGAARRHDPHPLHAPHHAHILRGLQVYKDRMLDNLNLGGGVVFSGRVARPRRGGHEPRRRLRGRPERCDAGVEGEGGFRELLEEREEVRERLSTDLGDLFDPSYALRNVGVVFERVEEL